MINEDLKNFALYVRDDVRSKNLMNQIKEFLTSNGFIYNPEFPELVICIGGDGTILRAIHHYYERLEEICFVGLHTGTLGFLTDYTQQEIIEFLVDLTSKEANKEYLTLIEIVEPHSKERYHALNEVRIGSFSRTVTYDIYIDGEFFETTVGSGICIATQAGSTAISRALGGAVVDNGLDIFQLCEIMPNHHKGFHSLRNPYIMNSNRELYIRFKNAPECDMAYDHLSVPLENVDGLKIHACSKKVCFARFKPYSYLKRLKDLY